MIRDLLTAEAQRDPYVWAAVLVAHAGIGVALWSIMGHLLAVALLYGAFEIVQAMSSARPLWWDSILDCCGVMLGAMLGWSLSMGNGAIGTAAIVAIGLIAAVGSGVRKRG